MPSRRRRLWPILEYILIVIPSLFLSCCYHPRRETPADQSTRPGKSIIAKKGEESQVKESSDSNTTVEEEEVKGKE